MGTACCDVHPSTNPALITVGDQATRYTFGDLRSLSNRLGNGLRALGIGSGDRVGVVAPQSLETALTHLALYKVGAVVLPLASLFGPDALAYRLGDSGARAVVTTPANLDKVVEAVDGLDCTVIVTGDSSPPGFRSFEDLIAGGDEKLEVADTGAEDPAFLIYTSGTTGPPKGALHAHRSLIGHLPGFELYYEYFPQPGDVHWTPADWAWIGGLMDSLLPSWYHGRPVVATLVDFEPDRAAATMADYRVTASFLPPTALKMMRAASVSRRDLVLRGVFSGGEALGEEMLAWAEEHLGVVINEGYGQTEANLTVGNCASTWPVRPGSMGRSLPGHEVAVLDENGRRVVGETGEIAVRGPDPVFMLRYWNRPEATEDKYLGDWLLTGDLGLEDGEGYLWFKSRKDDVINSMGYRIGPGEIEESLMGHPAVAHCAVIGVPDEIRGQVPKAFVVLKSGYEPGEALSGELQQHVRTRLAAHEVPRQVAFIDELPRTTTGKTMRRALRDL
jgi:acetyl-CoA synthetase